MSENKSKLKVGDKSSFSKTITEYDVYGFAGITGDFNPVHINQVKASETMFEKRICHGMLIASFISTVLGMYLPGNGTIYLSQNVKFIKPAFIGDTITAEVEILSINEKGIVTLNTEVCNEQGIKLVVGEAIVKI